jgi:subtilase family serine protease
MSRSFTCVAAVVSVFLLAAPGKTQNPSKNRIMRQIDSSDIAVVKGTAHPLARAQFDQGRLSPSQQLSGITLTFRLSPAQQAELDQLLREQQDRSSPNYHKWLTPEQYASRFGMSATDLAKVTSWLKAQGLVVSGISRSRNEVQFSGTVGQVEYALKTELHNYSIRGEQHFANAMDVVLPAAFSSEVLGVRGLNDFRPKPRLRALPRFTSNLSGNHFLIPGDFRTIYDLPAALDGTGQSIAVVGQTLIHTSDIDAFRSAASLPVRTASNFQQILVPGTGSAAACTGDETEADLDVEWPEGIAKNATIKYVYAGLGGGSCSHRSANVFDALQYAISNVAASVISISYGNCEANLTTSFVLTMQQWAQQANALGKTISGPSGDDGAADCDFSGTTPVTSATHGLAVDVPASIPEVTGVGGTVFTGDATQCPGSPPSCPGGVSPADPPYWNGSSSTTSGASALTYIPEAAWNDTTASIAAGGGFSATGGGASSIFGKPSWQTGTGVPTDAKRDVPDIALSASPSHDAYLICSQDYFDSATPPVNLTSCTTGFRASDGQGLQGIGGTSAGVPTFAGIVALINQATSANGQGNVNPMLYQLAGTSGVFHDVTSGTNKVPCTAGTKNCPSGTTSIGFSAGAGYDQVTGLGSLDVANLITAWLAATPSSADFSIDGLVSTVSAPGQSGTSTITVTAEHGFASTVALTCAPSSSTAQISCSLNPASVDLSSTGIGTSTLSITTVADLEPHNAFPFGLWFAASGGIFATIIFGGVPSRRRWAAIFGFVLFATLGLGVACGGGSGGGGNQSHGTPAGSYAITVTGTSGGGAISHSATVSLTVQ